MRDENEMRDESRMPAEQTDRGPQLGETETPTSGMPEGRYEDRPERPVAERPMPERAMPEPQASERPMPETPMAGGATNGADYGARFDELQARFIDDPREAVSAAESLVEEAVDRLMSDIRSRLDAIRSESGGDGDTERLRVAMREYREVLGQLSR
jgi:hypothetical protein